jgi:phosphate transport system substrate-binding protein
MKTLHRIATGLTLVSLAAAPAPAEEKANIVVDGSTTVGPIAKAFAEYYMEKYPHINITVSESGSGNGAKSLINGACAVASMSRPMKDSERQAALSKGIEPVEHVVAMDGIALAVHPSNPAGNLTLEQIRKIYTGEIRNWNELGGPNLAIVVISRDTNSGTYETFESLVLEGKKMAGSVEYVGSNGAIRQRILSTPAAVGYVGLAFIEGIKPLKINGIEVSAETVAAKKYPVARPLYFYTQGAPQEGSALAGFLQLSKTPQGRRIIEDTGFVPLAE